MRFIVVTAPTLRELADKLNSMSLGTGRLQMFAVNLAGDYEALIDMSPTHVVTNDDLWVEVDLDENVPNKIVMTA